MVDWLRLGADAEEFGTRTLQGVKRVGGLLRPLTIRPYRGWVAEGVAHVRARVLEEPRFEGAAEGLRIDSTIYANLTRWVVLDMPGVDVTISIGDASVTERSNQDGFVIAKIPVGDLTPGWHPVEFRADDQMGGEVRVNGRVVQPDPAAQVAFISDIDDTILRTGMTEGLRSIQRTLLRDAHGRKPIPGMPSLYRGLARGGGAAHPESTFFYLSSSPWNLYDMLIQFLAIRGFPRGPLLLTDWRPGPIPTTNAKETPGHKRLRLRRILDSYPELRFVLIGDDGESDPEIYEQFLKTDTDRIGAAFIRSVHGADNSKANGGVNSQARRQPAKPITCQDALSMARAAERMGLVDGLTVEEVMTEMGMRL